MICGSKGGILELCMPILPRIDPNRLPGGRENVKMSCLLRHSQGLWARKTVGEGTLSSCFMTQHMRYPGECFLALLRRPCILHLLGILLYKRKFIYLIRAGLLIILPKSAIFILLFSILLLSVTERGMLKSLTLFVDLFCNILQ